MVIWDFDTKWGQRKVVDLKWKLKELKVALFVHTKKTNELEQVVTKIFEGGRVSSLFRYVTL